MNKVDRAALYQVASLIATYRAACKCERGTLLTELSTCTSISFARTTFSKHFEIQIPIDIYQPFLFGAENWRILNTELGNRLPITASQVAIQNPR